VLQDVLSGGSAHASTYLSEHLLRRCLNVGLLVRVRDIADNPAASDTRVRSIFQLHVDVTPDQPAFEERLRVGVWGTASALVQEASDLRPGGGYDGTV
jgi:hypothetical protein